LTIPGTYDRMYPFIGYLVAPTSGTLSITFGSGSTCMDYVPMTVQNADQISPIDASFDTNAVTGSLTVSTSTSVGHDLLLSYALFAFHSAGPSYGTGETEVFSSDDAVIGNWNAGSWKAAGASAGTESMTTTWGSSHDFDQGMVAVKPGSSAANGIST